MPPRTPHGPSRCGRSLAVLLAFSFAAACAPPLRIGTSGDYPPFSALDASGELSGFDVEVARAYARDRRRPLELVPFRWPDLTERFVAGDFDVVMSGVTVRGDRLARAPMTAAVARASAVLVGPAPAPAERPRRIAVNRGGHLEQVARSRLRDVDLRTVDDNESLPALVRRGEVDAVVTDTLELASFGPGFAVIDVLQPDRKAYWVRDPMLADDLDEWLARREQDGTLPALRVRLLGDSAGPVLPRTESRIVDLVARRLMLMPFVAEAKRVRNLPVDAPAREAEIEARMLGSARAAGLCTEPYRSLVRAQIEAAKAVQRATLAGPAAAAPSFDLEGDIRPAIDRIDGALLRELARSAPLSSPETALAGALQGDARVAGLARADIVRLAAALAAQRPCAMGG